MDEKKLRNVKRKIWRENNLEKDRAYHRDYMKRWRANKIEQMDERQKLLYKLARRPT